MSSCVSRRQDVVETMARLYKAISGGKRMMKSRKFLHIITYYCVIIMKRRHVNTGRCQTMNELNPGVCNVIIQDTGPLHIKLP